SPHAHLWTPHGPDGNRALRFVVHALRRGEVLRARFPPKIVDVPSRSSSGKGDQMENAIHVQYRLRLNAIVRRREESDPGASWSAADGVNCRKRNHPSGHERYEANGSRSLHGFHLDSVIVTLSRAQSEQPAWPRESQVKKETPEPDHRGYLPLLPPRDFAKAPTNPDDWVLGIESPPSGGLGVGELARWSANLTAVTKLLGP